MNKNLKFFHFQFYKRGLEYWMGTKKWVLANQNMWNMGSLNSLPQWYQTPSFSCFLGQSQTWLQQSTGPATSRKISPAEKSTQTSTVPLSTVKPTRCPFYFYFNYWFLLTKDPKLLEQPLILDTSITCMELKGHRRNISNFAGVNIWIFECPALWLAWQGWLQNMIDTAEVAAVHWWCWMNSA